MIQNRGAKIFARALPILAAVVTFFFALGPASPAFSQTEQEFVDVLVGQWSVYDDLYALDGKTCQIELTNTKSDGNYELATQSCNLELGILTGWRIGEGQLVLLAEQSVIATLGGNQFRMSGQSNIGAPVILDRAGEKAAETTMEQAVEASGCYYLGFTSTCADERQLSKPTVSPDSASARIGILVNLNVRTEAREDAGVIGVVPANSCIVTDVCATASDGVWCRAAFGDVSGWVKKVALRQERWPVVTFVNQCQTD